MPARMRCLPKQSRDTGGFEEDDAYKADSIENLPPFLERAEQLACQSKNDRTSNRTGKGRWSAERIHRKDQITFGAHKVGRGDEGGKLRKEGTSKAGYKCRNHKGENLVEGDIDSHAGSRSFIIADGNKDDAGP